MNDTGLFLGVGVITFIAGIMLGASLHIASIDDAIEAGVLVRNRQVYILKLGEIK